MANKQSQPDSQEPAMMHRWLDEPVWNAPFCVPQTRNERYIGSLLKELEAEKLALKLIPSIQGKGKEKL